MQQSLRQPIHVPGLQILAATALLLSAVYANGQVPKQKRDTSIYTRTYTLASKECRDKPESQSEGDDFAKSCNGYAGYRLLLTGSDYRVNYAVENPKLSYQTYFFPLENGAAQKYERADLYDSKPGDKVEWLLAGGKPFAVCIRMAFYKNTGSAKTFANAKNRAAEFIFVRGLGGYEAIQFDVATSGTAFNPDEQARYLAYKAFENHGRSK